MTQTSVRGEVELWFKNETEVVRPRGGYYLLICAAAAV